MKLAAQVTYVLETNFLLHFEIFLPGIGVVLDTRLCSATRKVDEISSELKALEGGHQNEPLQRTAAASNSKTELLPTFENFFAMTNGNAKGKDESTNVELNSLQASSSFLCKHCHCQGSFLDVSRAGPIHKAACPRHSSVRLLDPSSCGEADELNRDESMRVLRQKLDAALEEKRRAAEDDCVVIRKQHVKGPALRSGLLANGDAILSVDGTPIGPCVRASRPSAARSL